MNRGDRGDRDHARGRGLEEQWTETVHRGDCAVVVDCDGGWARDVDAGHGQDRIDGPAAELCHLLNQGGPAFLGREVGDHVGVAEVRPDDTVALGFQELLGRQPDAGGGTGDDVSARGPRPGAPGPPARRWGGEEGDLGSMSIFSGNSPE
jgi:hypothetical protein